MDRYHDLLRNLELRGIPKRKSVDLVIWSLDEDSRAAIFLHPPERVRVGPFPPAEDCVLRFGMGIREDFWAKSDGVEFTVFVRRGERRKKIFSELLVPGDLSAPKWIDREVPIPPGSEFSIVLGVDPGPAGQAAFDQAGYSDPHLVCRSAGSIPRQHPELPTVLLISIDTLRADHLGFYGYPRETSPGLDALARDATVFEACFAPAPYTLPSHGTLLTGLSPAEHGAGFDYPKAPLSRTVPTLAGRLQRAGYRTVALTAGGLVRRRWGLARGFDEWRELQRANLPSMMPAVFDLLDDERGKPLFLFLHTYDVHGPYQQPEGFRYFREDHDASGQDGSEEWRRILESRYHHYQDFERFGSVQEAVAAYDSGIRFVDAQLERLFERLRELGLFDRALIVVTSDHGESLFEAGRYLGHSHSLEDREVRVPLVIRVGGESRGERRSQLVDLRDVAPTILAHLGLSVESLPGIDLLSLEEDSPTREFVDGGSSHMVATYVRSERFKLISPPGEAWRPRWENLFAPVLDRFPLDWQVYDLGRDPVERENLYGEGGQYPGELRELLSELRSLESPGALTGKEEADLSKAEEEQLRALGYVQ